MNPFEKIELKKDTFTKKEMIVYNILQKNPDLILRGSITSLAKDYQVSQSTITRFCQKIGYDGFNEFKFDVFRSEKQGRQEQNNNLSTIDSYCRLLNILNENIDNEMMERFAKSIIHADTIIVTGSHKSSLPAKMLQYNLFKIHKKVIFLATDEFHDIDQIANKNDLVVVFTNRGNGLSTFNNIKEKKEKNQFQLAFITMHDKLFVKKISDYYIWLPSSSNQNFDQYLENQIVFFVYVDLLTSQIANLI